MNRRSITAAVAAIAMGVLVFAQPGRLASPAGTAATQVGGKYVGGPDGIYQGGKWIEISYGRPIKRSRDLWGAGATYGKMLNSGAPVWRAGANMSTRFKTEVPIVINGQTVRPGEYSLFIDLKENNWTFVLSTWPAQAKYDPNNKDALWGSYFYTPAKDVLRVPMKLETLPHAVEQLTWAFVDMTDAGGLMAISWGNQLASVPFKVGT